MAQKYPNFSIINTKRVAFGIGDFEKSNFMSYRLLDVVENSNLKVIISMAMFILNHTLNVL